MEKGRRGGGRAWGLGKVGEVGVLGREWRVAVGSGRTVGQGKRGESVDLV